MISSLVSLAKRDIEEHIPGMRCSRYFIEASEDNVPRILYVEDSHYYKPDLDGGQDAVLVPSEQIVDSIVKMHITSQILANAIRHPALFAIANEAVTMDDLSKRHKDTMLLHLNKQREWFKSLVQLADDDWQQARKHNMISDVQRTAATELGLKRDWLLDIHDEAISGCPFCGSNLLDSMAPICPTCHKVHNPQMLQQLEAKMSQITKASAKV